MPTADFSGENAPAATDFASVIVAFGIESDVRRSHGVAAEADIAHIIANGNAISTRQVVFMAAILARYAARNANLYSLWQPHNGLAARSAAEETGD